MIYTEQTRKAMRLCYEAHHGALDKSGVPYVFHPIHLAEQMPTEETCIAALLHDVVEDTDYTLDDLLGLGIPASVVDALRLLTHDPAIPYLDYVRDLRQNPIARQVKLADLRHNSDLTRLRSVDAAALARIEKYRAAIKLLEDVE